MKQIFSKSIDQDVLCGGWTDIRSENGKLFRYAFINRNGYVDIAIQTPRSPRGKHEDDNYHLTHKLPVKSGGDIDKICFHAGKEPKTVEKAMQALKEYIELYTTWLDTGKTIDQQIKELRN